MGYSVVETPKRNSTYTELTAVPDGWVDKTQNIVYWPRNLFVTLRADENSVFEKNWIPKVIKKIYHTELDRNTAEEMVNHYVNSGVSSASEWETDTEESQSTKKSLVSQPRALPRAQQYSLKTVSSPKLQHTLPVSIPKVFVCNSMALQLNPLFDFLRRPFFRHHHQRKSPNRPSKIVMKLIFIQLIMIL